MSSQTPPAFTAQSFWEKTPCNEHPSPQPIRPSTYPQKSHLLIQNSTRAQDQDQAQAQTQTQTQTTLLTLPPELLTQILTLALGTARLCPRCQKNHTMHHILWPNLYSVIGLSPLPLLFVNWHIYRELLDLIYGRGSEHGTIAVGMTGYRLLSSRITPDEESVGVEENVGTKMDLDLDLDLGTVDWTRTLAFREYVQEITLRFAPSEHGSRLTKWGGPKTQFIEFNIASTPPEIITEFVTYLKTFQALKKVVVVLDVSRNQLDTKGGNPAASVRQEGVAREQDLDGLLPLFRIKGVEGEVGVEMVMTGGVNLRNKYVGKVGEVMGVVREEVREWAALRGVGFVLRV